MQGGASRRFEGQVAIVTGASTGIGLATVRRLASEGAQVIATHRRDQEVEELTDVRVLRLDVTSEANWAEVVEIVLQRYGQLDLLVNNAGKRESGLIEETSLDLWRDLIDTNLTSVFLGCRAVVPTMKAAGRGAIVNVGSITGIRGTENMVAYSASKSGITTLTASLALDLAPFGVRVNAVCPAAVDTRMVRDWLQSATADDAAARAVLSKHPLGRIGSPDEVAGTIAFLGSVDAGFMTGLSIPVDGGRSIR